MSRQVIAAGIVAVALIAVIGALMWSAGNPLVNENAIAQQWGQAICARTYPANLFFVFSDVDAAQYDADLRAAFQELIAALPVMHDCQAFINTTATRRKLPGALYDPKMDFLVYVPLEIHYTDQAGNVTGLSIPELQQVVVVQDREQGEKILPTFANPFARSTLKMGQMGYLHDENAITVGNVTVQSAERFDYAGSHFVCLRLSIYAWQYGWQGYGFTLSSGRSTLSDATPLTGSDALPSAYRTDFWPAVGDRVLPNAAYQPHVCFSYPSGATLDFDHLYLAARAASFSDWHYAIPVYAQVTATALPGDLADDEARARLPFQSITVQAAQVADDHQTKRWVITGRFVPSALPAAVDSITVQCTFRLLLSNHREILPSSCGGIDRVYARTEADWFAVRLEFVSDRYVPDEDLATVSAVELDDTLDIAGKPRQVVLWRAAAN